MLRLGYSTKKDHAPIELSLDERRQGTYIIGTTGTGKSTLLKNIVLQDLTEDLPKHKRPGLCVLDPHGDLTDELLQVVPVDRIDDVILFNPMEIEWPFGLNLLACNREDPFEVRWMISTVMGTLQRLFSESWGPRLEYVLRNVLLTSLELPQATLLEVLKLLNITVEEQKVLVEIIKDPVLKQFWKTFPYSDRLRYELVSSTLNKISPFLDDRMMRNIVGQPKNTLELQEIMDDGKILFINLSKGDLGEANSSLLGSVIVNLILIAALKRRPIPEDDRRSFHLIVDEFQNFATESFAILQSEARKYAVDVTVAHQYRDQLDLLSKGSTLNVGNLIVFRVTGRDSYELASQFDNTPPEPQTHVEPIYREYEYAGLPVLIETALKTGEGKLYQEVELQRRPYNDVEAEMANQLSILLNYQAWCRLIYDPGSRKEEGVSRLAEFKFRTDKFDKSKMKPWVADKIRENSRKMAKSREDVEKEIFSRPFISLRKVQSKTQEPDDE